MLALGVAWLGLEVAWPGIPLAWMMLALGTVSLAACGYLLASALRTSKASAHTRVTNPHPGNKRRPQDSFAAQVNERSVMPGVGRPRRMPGTTSPLAARALRRFGAAGV